MICEDCAGDARCAAEGWARFGMRDSLSVPMVTERRNAGKQVVESVTIGVVHVFNKRGGLQFTNEDAHVLMVLARNAAAVIASARAAMTVADEKKQLESTLLSMPVGLLVVTRARRLQLVNATAARLLDLPTGEGAGAVMDHAIRNLEILAFLEEALDGTQSLAREFEIGERFFQAQADVQRDEQGAPIGVLCAFNDVTALRNVERMKSDFVSTVSHELRTPLTSIKGFIRTLLDDPEEAYYDRETRMEFYGIIDAECERLVRLISDLLSVSRIERGLPLQFNYITVDVPTIVEQSLAFHRGFSDRHEMHALIGPGVGEIETDRDKLDQVLTNLLSNAIKYSPDGGSIRVTVEDDGDQVAFTVSDEGMGIPADHLEKVFERFHRVNSGDSQRVGGTGIGLFLTRSLVQALGGEIHIESALGEGSRFHFTIPKAKPADPG